MMLLKVSNLIQRFAEGRSERATPVQALRRALNLVVTDSQATYASLHIYSECQEHAMMVAAFGAPDSFVSESGRLAVVKGSGSSLEAALHQQGRSFFCWPNSSEHTPSPAPKDWVQLAHAAGLVQLSACPIKICDKVLGLITLGFRDGSGTAYNTCMWPTYLQLVAASMSAMAKDSTLPKYLALVKEVVAAPEMDLAMHAVMTHVRVILGQGMTQPHTWYRIGLTAENHSTACIFDDLTQVPASLMQRSTSHSSAASFNVNLLANGGIMRTVVLMKNTVMKIAVHNRQQVMIPDVQKVINQSGNVSADIFNTRLIKPPTSVLVFPLKVKAHIFGVVFCMSNVATDFADVAAKLREVCEIMSPHLLHLLATSLASEYMLMQLAQPHASCGFSPTSQDSTAPPSPVIYNLSSSAPPFGSERQTSEYRGGGSLGGGGSGGGGMHLGGSYHNGGSHSNDTFLYTQSRSSTGALVTGLTEKLNQKRIQSSMDFYANHKLSDLQVTGLLGEGGFAKVFSGLWRGLVVGIKVVCDDGKNEKMVMKNAHEIAILSSLSHPNIVQAYSCLTDVLVTDLLSTSWKYATQVVLTSPAHKYLVALEDKSCHIEVIEYCDLGNLSSALKNNIFLADPVFPAEPLMPDAKPPKAQVNLRTLLLTLIEIASACGYLHKMGVVHCDMKPANVLLKSSSTDTRGFTAKVTDFGLSRVEDDEASSSFPFNSCGTAAYVAPEALITHKKVNSSVDVYAFGILMWEMYTGQRPYGSMKQQQLVEEVVMRGLRPRFSSSTPPPYVALAQACWSGSAAARPQFDDALGQLHMMLQAMDDREMEAVLDRSSSSPGGRVDFLPATIMQHGSHGSDGGRGAAATHAVSAPWIRIWIRQDRIPGRPQNRIRIEPVGGARRSRAPGNGWLQWPQQMQHRLWQQQQAVQQGRLLPPSPVTPPWAGSSSAVSAAVPATTAPAPANARPSTAAISHLRRTAVPFQTAADHQAAPTACGL
ncbi:MAG: hypothetical protein WDW36_000829 [Sanguina aurantia]